MRATSVDFGLGTPPAGAEPAEDVYVRVGKYGPFLEQGERRASLPEGMPPEELTIEKALELLDTGQQTDEPLGECPDTHKPVFLKQGTIWTLRAAGLAGRS